MSLDALLGVTHSPRRVRVRAGYDVASTDPANRKHWENADSYSANAGLDASTRRTMRDRSRYEADNNCYAGGLPEQIAVDLVGTGPRLRLNLPGLPRESARAVERAWATWARAADLAEDLRLLSMARIKDGEGFALLIDNPALASAGMTNVTLDLALYEADQVSDPWDYGLDPLYTDGVRVDEHGNPVEYTFLETHPGGVKPFASWATRKLPASAVLHWFKPLRPGQSRGIPVLAKALPLFAQLRRYTLATLSAAELAAMLAGVLESDLPPDQGGPVSVEAMDEIELVRGALLTMPAGWKANQFKPEQPVSGYREFKSELISEASRAALVPRNLASGDSSAYNYSSGRLDHLPYQRVVRVERDRLRNRVLDRVFLAWVQEAALAGAIPPALPPVASWAWDWHWDGFDSLDPQKDAQTDETELRNQTTTLAEIYARKGQDWEEAVRQRAIELRLLNDLGLSAAQAAMTPAAPAPGGAGTDESGEAAEVAAGQGGGVQATALNGAQIASLVQIADKVALRQYPAAAAVAIVQAAFPLMSLSLIRSFIDALATYEAPAPATPEEVPSAPA